MFCISPRIFVLPALAGVKSKIYLIFTLALAQTAAASKATIGCGRASSQLAFGV